MRLILLLGLLGLFVPVQLAHAKVRTYTAGPWYRRQVETSTTGGIVTVTEDIMTVTTTVIATVTGDVPPYTTTDTSTSDGVIPDTTATITTTTSPTTTTADAIARRGEMTLVQKGAFATTTLVGYWQIRLEK
jgi:hypothetical protein